MKPIYLDPEILRANFTYARETGVFARREASARHAAGHTFGPAYPGSLVYISAGYRRFPAARAAWVYVTGMQPKGYIHHINGEKDDNRFENLVDIYTDE